MLLRWMLFRGNKKKRRVQLYNRNTNKQTTKKSKPNQTKKKKTVHKRNAQQKTQVVAQLKGKVIPVWWL